jgi:predicted Holliday junction resolvase-like endonuclease
MDTLTIILILIFFIAIAIAYWLGSKAGAFRKNIEWEEVLPEHRKDAILKSRAVLGGHFSEQLAPFLPNFPFKPNECLFMGKPIDFIAFKGMDEKNIDEVVFVEVKSGKSKLSSQERKLKKAIENKKVRWEEYRIPEELVKKGDIEEKIKDILDKD